MCTNTLITRGELKSIINKILCEHEVGQNCHYARLLEGVGMFNWDKKITIRGISRQRQQHEKEPAGGKKRQEVFWDWWWERVAKSIKVSPTSFLPSALCDNLTSCSSMLWKIVFEYRLICEEILKQKVISQGKHTQWFHCLELPKTTEDGINYHRKHSRGPREYPKGKKNHLLIQCWQPCDRPGAQTGWPAKPKRPLGEHLSAEVQVQAPRITSYSSWSPVVKGSLWWHWANNPEMEGLVSSTILTQNSGREPPNILFIYLFTQTAYSTYYNYRKSDSKPSWRKIAIMFTDSGGQVFDNTVASACLCSMLSGPQLEGLKAEDWVHLKAHSLTYLAVNTGCWLEHSSPPALLIVVSLQKSLFDFITIWRQSSKGKHPKGQSRM